MKLGDIVTVNSTSDKAWSVCYNRSMDVGRIRRFGLLGEMNTFEVIGVNCQLQGPSGSKWTANTLIRNTETGAIWGMNSCNLQMYVPITVVFMSLGKDVSNSLCYSDKVALLVAFMGGQLKGV